MVKLTKKKKLRIAVIISSLVLILAAIMFVLYLTIGRHLNKEDLPAYDFSLFDKNTILTNDQIQQDQDELINQVENIHPFFSMQEVAGYETAKQRFLDANITTAGDFYFAAAEYLAIFNDLHTMATADFPEFSDYLYLDVFSTGYIENDKYMMYPYGEANEAVELYAINGVPYKDIFSKYIPMENTNSMHIGIAGLQISVFLKRAGLEWENTLTLTYWNNEGNLFDVVHDIVDLPSESPNPTEFKNFEAVIQDDEILYIHIRSMEDDGSYSDCIQLIKEAVAGGIWKVIIDVTGNPGGSDGYGTGILDALGFDYSRMGFIVRYSQVTAKYRGTWRSSGCSTTQSFKYRSENKNEIELKVFCDEYSGSAAISGIAALCSYSDLGEIVGRMPGQNVNFCGNVMRFQLTHSKVAYILPLTYSYFERDGQKAPDQLTVDVEVPATANFMDFVIWRNEVNMSVNLDGEL